MTATAARSARKRATTRCAEHRPGVYLKVNSLRKAGEKIIYAGDFNSWATNRAGDAPREYLMRQGFYDTAAAAIRINIKYPTVNHFKTTLAAKRIRLDVVMIKGSKRRSGTRTS